MLKDVTLGRYYSADSKVHELDPRTKIRFIIIYAILLLLDRNLPLYILLTVIFVATVIASKVSVSYMLRGSVGIYIFITIFSAISIFTTLGTTVFSIGGLTATREGFIKCGFLIWRMILLILMSSMLMYTTRPICLTDGLEKCFHMSGGLAMGITIALRFVSVLFEELHRITTAMETRGATIKKGSIKQRFKNLKYIIVPLFQNSIDRAKNIGEALDAKCYTGGKNRTKLNPLKYSTGDIVAYIILLAMMIVGIKFIFTW